MAKEIFDPKGYKRYPIYDMIGQGVVIVCSQKFDLNTGLKTGPIFPIYIFHAHNMMKRMHTERKWYVRFCRWNIECSTSIYFENTSKFKDKAKALIAHYKPEFNFKNRNNFTLLKNG